MHDYKSHVERILNDPSRDPETIAAIESFLPFFKINCEARKRGLLNSDYSDKEDEEFSEIVDAFNEALAKKGNYKKPDINFIFGDEEWFFFYLYN